MKRLMERIQQLEKQVQTQPQTQTGVPMETAGAQVNPAPSNITYSQYTEKQNATGNASIPRNTLYPNLGHLDSAKSTLTGLPMVQHQPYTYLPQTTFGPSAFHTASTSENIVSVRFQPTAPPEPPVSPADQYNSKRDRPASRRRNNEKSGKDDFKKIPCPNENDGCFLSMKMAEIDGHLKECPFSDLACPLTAFVEPCYWRGKLSHMGSHFKDEHPHYRSSVGTKNTISEFKNNSYSLQFIELGPFKFVVHLKVSRADDMVFMNVQLLSTAISASKWRFELHVYKKGNPGAEYQFTGSCCSLGTPINELFEKCVSIPLSCARSEGKRSSLTYKIYIRKQDCLENTNPRGTGRGGGRGRGRGR